MKKVNLSLVLFAIAVFLISSSMAFGQAAARPKPVIIVPPPRSAVPPGGNQPPGGGGGGANVPNNYTPPTGSSDTYKSTPAPQNKTPKWDPSKEGPLG
jgi:hypothetical protein